MDKKLKNIYFYENCFADVLSFERWKEKMNKREVMKVRILFGIIKWSILTDRVKKKLKF